jgi:hypothetical protein
MESNQIVPPTLTNSESTPRSQLANFKGKIAPRPDQTGKRWAKPKRIPPLFQAVALQAATFKLSIKPGVGANELCKLSAAWAAIEDRRQVLAGVGRPKSVEAANSRKHSTKRTTAPAMMDPSNDHDADPGDSKPAAA